MTQLMCALSTTLWTSASSMVSLGDGHIKGAQLNLWKMIRRFKWYQMVKIKRICFLVAVSNSQRLSKKHKCSHKVEVKLMRSCWKKHIKIWVAFSGVNGCIWYPLSEWVLRKALLDYGIEPEQLRRLRPLCHGHVPLS